MLNLSSPALSALCLSTLAVGLTAPLGPGSPQDEGLELRTTAAVDAFLQDTGTQALVLVVELGGDPLMELSRGAWPDGEDAGPESATTAGWLLEAVLGARLLELAANDELGLDDPVLEHLPELGWDAPGPTLRQLAGHCAGIPALEGWLSAARPASADEQPVEPVLAWAVEHPPAFEPGSCFEWSDGNLLVLAAALARAGDRTLGEFVDGLLAEPFAGRFELELGEASANARDASGLSPGLRQLLDGRTIELSCAAGVELVHGLGSGNLFGREALQELRAGVRVAARDRSPMAFGLGVTQLDPSEGTVLSGVETGPALRLVHYLPEDLSIAVSGTCSEAQLEALERELTRLVLDRPGPEVEDRPLTLEELGAHVGGYQVGCDTLRISLDDAHLVLRGEGFDGLRLLYQGGSVFAVESDPETRLVFELADGAAVGFQLVQRGTAAHAVRVE